VERLKAKRNELTTRLNLAPGVLCPNATLEAIARGVPRSLEELRTIPGVRQWQVEAVGSDLLAAMSTTKAQ
jgi:ribonuclease D